MVTEPSKERIAAALALAEADDAWYGKTEGPPELGWDETSRVHYLALQAYRATAPKLRTRADVDREIVNIVRSHQGGTLISPDHKLRLNQLCSERTAPDPKTGPHDAPDEVAVMFQPSARLTAVVEMSERPPWCSVCDGNGYTDSCTCKYVHACRMCEAGAEYLRSDRPLMLNPNRAKERNE